MPPRITHLPDGSRRVDFDSTREAAEYTYLLEQLKARESLTAGPGRPSNGKPRKAVPPKNLVETISFLRAVKDGPPDGIHGPVLCGQLGRKTGDLGALLLKAKWVLKSCLIEERDAYRSVDDRRGGKRYIAATGIATILQKLEALEGKAVAT